MDADVKLLEAVQGLLNKHAETPEFDLRAIEVIREPDLIRVLIAHAERAHIEDYVRVLARVEAEIDIGDELTLILQPIASDAA